MEDLELVSEYISIYIPLVVILGLQGFFKKSKSYSFFFAITITFLATLLLFLRDPYASDDSGSYSSMFDSIEGFHNVLNSTHGDYLFSLVQFTLKEAGVDAEGYLIAQSFLFYLLMIIGFRILFKSNKSFLLALSLFSVTSTFILLSTNIMRQGQALSLIVISIGLFSRKYSKTGAFTLFMSVLSHSSAFAIILIVVYSNYISIKFKRLKWIVLIIPCLPIFGWQLIYPLSSILGGGVFSKVESFSEYGYSNDLVYIKIVILYAFLLLFYFLGDRFKWFLDEFFYFTFVIYMLMVSLVLFTSPVLLISSRFIYYASALLPVLITISIFQNRNISSALIRMLAVFLFAIFYGFLVFNFGSIKSQIGYL